MAIWQSAGKVRMTPRGTWDGEEEYYVLDIVTSPDGLIAYMAKENVPVGTPLTNTNYWKVINDMTQAKDVAVAIAQEAADDATSAAEQARGIRNEILNDLGEVQEAVDTELHNLSSIKGDNLYFDEVTKLLYLTSNGEIISDGISVQAAGEGGGGGGSSYSYAITLSAIGERQINIAAGNTVNIGFNYSSVDEDEIDDGNGVGKIYINSILKRSFQVSQGANTYDVTELLSNGTNNLRLTVENSEGRTKSISYTIIVVSLSITTTFNPIDIYSGGVVFNYTVSGAGEKTMHFVMDGVEIGTETVNTSGRSRTYAIPAQEYGAHVFEVYATATINGIDISSSVITLSMLWGDEATNKAVIGSTYTGGTVTQGDTVTIPYMVYDPLYEIASVTLSVIDEDDNVYSTSTISQGRTATTWAISDYPAGDITFRITCRETDLDIPMEVEEYVFPIEVATDSLKLQFDAAGRSNAEDNPESWSYEDDASNVYEASFSGFGWNNADGWIYDADGVTVLRFLPGDSMTIPFKPFIADARETGYTIEVDLATRDVRDYESIVMSCLSGEINGVGGIGFKIQSQEATFRTQGLPAGISMLFKEDSRVHICFSVEARSANRLIYIYINGVMCGAIQYATSDNIQQANPVGLTIGAESCGLDLYKIRCYARSLDRNEQRDNYIVDRPTLSARQASYKFNDILDPNTQEVTLSSLPKNVPYMIVKSIRMPTYKGDKLNADITFVDPMDMTKSFVAEGSQIDVQGTSSAGYPVKNSKIKLKNLVVNGESAKTYSIHTGEHGVATLCTKVDYASSEGANNVELVQLYELICEEQGFLTPPQELDASVRQGISGRPIVMFWQNSETNEVTFYAKANMNWDKGNPSAFGFSDFPNAESWEFKNNTSNHCLFKSANMAGWENDFEARYPEDYTDVSSLQRVLAWVVSTDRTAATGNVLDAPVTYDGVEYTVDNVAYRLAKFKNEFEDWFDKDLAIFYYIFTQTFLMVDSRAKNMFITTYDGEKWIASLPYDMDTSIGINNEGQLKFEYNLEDTDTVDGSNVYNGQNSVLWNNVRDAFGSDIADMYKTLRTRSRYFNYEYVKDMFEEHQSIWPERLWNEDAFIKYLYPFLVNGEDNLAMLQGSKESQRDWWLFNAFRYWDSKYETGDSTTNVITLRTYASGDIELVPYSHIYARLKYGSYDVKERATRNENITLVCPFDPTESANDTETYLYSADRIAQIGDLSGLNVGYADFSKAVKLQTLKLGDNATGYENTHLEALTVGNNELLTTLDIRNCPNLKTNINLSGCTGIEEIYASGSGISGVSLPDGGHLDTIELPDSVTNLTIMNQTRLDTFSMEGYTHLQTLRIENTPNVPLETIINNATNLAYVRLMGVNWTATNSTTLQATINKLKTCYGQDASGANTDHAVVNGRVNVSSISPELLTEINETFPNLIVVVNGVPQYVITFVNYDNTVVYREVVAQGGNAYDPVSAGDVAAPTRTNTDTAHYVYNGWDGIPTNVQSNISVTAVYITSWRVRYQNYDNTVLQDVYVVDGGTAVYSGSTPTKPSTAQYTYAFNGWSGNENNVTEPRIITALYTQSVRTYTVTFARNSADGGGTLQTVNNVPYGGSATYTGSTPTTTKGDATSYPFEGWSPQPTNIQGNTTCYAVFGSPIEVKEITDSWDAIISAIERGSYVNKYKVGNYKPLDLGTEGTVNMQIVGMNVDPLASGSGTAPLTFISKELLVSQHHMNPAIENDPEDSSKSKEGTGSIGGWEKTEMRSYLKDTIKPLIPEAVRNALLSVTKYSRIYNTSNSIVNNVESSEDVWIPSYREICGGTYYESSGPVYTTVFVNNTARVKTNANGFEISWWLRSAYAKPSFFYITTTGDTSYSSASPSRGVALGFCLGVPEIADSWSDIFAAEDNGTYSTKYAVGDMKSLTINDHTYMMQIVAMDSDVKSDGTGNAKITWLCKNFWVTHNMNSTSTTAGGWKDSEMRSWLRETVYPMIPSEVRNRIVAVDKTYKDYNDGTLTVSDTVWIPSMRELFNNTSYENSGVVYPSVFNSAASRVKYNMLNGTASNWWARSAENELCFKRIGYNGNGTTTDATSLCGVDLGFCT